MIIKLQPYSLTPLDKFQAESMSLNLSERTSTASMTLSEEAPTLAIGDWIQIENGPGKEIVWRVRSVETQAERRTRTVQLEHIVAYLKDLIMFGEVTPETVSGGNVNPTATQAINYILSQQAVFKLGVLSYKDKQLPYSFNGDTLFAALETVTNSLTKCCWHFDFSSYPFKISFSPGLSFTSEMRMSRNIQTLRMTVDKSRMYTRIFPIGANNLILSDTPYISMNESIYGVICHTETDQSMDTEEKLREWATERLRNHCEPYVTVTISGLELAELTGESLDKLAIGSTCNVPLPELGTSISERITRLSYPDVIHTPMVVTVTLANDIPDVASIIKQQTQTTTRSTRVSATKAGKDHAWIVDTESHVGLVAEAVAGEGADKNWSLVSSIMVNGQGINQRVIATEATTGEIVGSDLWVNKNNITGVTGEFYKDKNGKIHIKKGSGLFMDRDNASFGLYDEGNLTAGVMINTINGDDTQATLKADVIDIAGVVSALESYDISAGDITGNIVTGESLVSNGGVSGTDGYFSNGVWVGEDEMLLLDASVSGNILTITKTDGTSINFSKATSLSGVWDGNRTFTFTATPQGVSRYTTLFSAVPSADISWSGNTGTATLKATLDGGETSYTVGTVTVDGTALYNTVGVSGSWSNGTYIASKIANGLDSVSTSLMSNLINGTYVYDETTHKYDYTQYTGEVAYASGELAVSTGTTVTINTSGAYNAGSNSVGVSGSWSGGTYIASKIVNGLDSVSTSLMGNLINGTYAYNEATHKYNYNQYTGEIAYASGELAVSTGKTVTINTSGAYNAGLNEPVTSATWSWQSGYPKVVLSPQGTINGTDLTLDGIIFNASSQVWAKDYKSFDEEFYVYDTSGRIPYRETLTINTIPAYNAGLNEPVTSATWSWQSGYPKVVLSPQGTINGTGLTLDGITERVSTRTWAQDYKSFDSEFYVYDTSSNEPYKETLTIYTTESYNAGVSAPITSQTWSWVSGYPQVSIQPQNKTISGARDLTLDGITFDGNTAEWVENYHVLKQDYYVYDVSGNVPYRETGLRVDTKAAYDAGVAAPITSATWSWVSGYPKVVIDPQGKTINGSSLTLDGITYDASSRVWEPDYHAFTQDFYVYDVSGNVAYREYSLRFDTTDAFDQGAASVTHSPEIKTSDVWTSSSIPSGATELNKIKTQYEAAKADSDNFCIRVRCNGTTKVYYCTP